MKRVEVTTQAELEAAVKAGNAPMVRTGFYVAWGSAHVEALGNAHVEALGNAHVVAWDSAHVVALDSAHVEALGNAHVEARDSAHVVAWDSAHVVAWGNAHVEARGNAHVVAWGAVIIRLLKALKITASAGVTIVKQGEAKDGIEGGIVVEPPAPTTAAAWCVHYGVEVKDGVATLYKGVGVGDDYRSERGGDYTPGTTPEATDWDGGEAECGGGLHFSPCPYMAHQFCNPSRYVACPVAVTDMRAPQPGDMYPAKIKAAKCCGPVWECDREGNPIPKEAA